MQKICKQLVLPRQFYTLHERNFSNLRTLLSITFPQGFRKTKWFRHWMSGSGGKKTGKRSEKHRYQKILLSKTKFAQKLIFFVCGNFTPFISTNLQIWAHWISKNFGHPNLGCGGKKTFKRYLKSEDTDEHTYTDIWLIKSIDPEGQCFENIHNSSHHLYNFFLKIVLKGGQ